MRIEWSFCHICIRTCMCTYTQKHTHTAHTDIRVQTHLYTHKHSKTYAKTHRGGKHAVKSGYYAVLPPSALLPRNSSSSSPSPPSSSSLSPPSSASTLSSYCTSYYCVNATIVLDPLTNYNKSVMYYGVGEELTLYKAEMHRNKQLQDAEYVKCYPLTACVPKQERVMAIPCVNYTECTSICVSVCLCT